MRAGKSPFEIIDPIVSLEDYPAGVFGMNVGNFVYSDAMHRIISTPSTDVLPNGFLGERFGVTSRYIDSVNADFDRFVIPLANAFRVSFLGSLYRLAQTVKRLKIPVTVVGVGVAGGAGSLQRPVEEVPSELKSAVKKFVNAVLDRSASIGVRGENTRRFLRNLGYGDDVIDVIGCPSLFRNGLEQRIDKRVPAIGPESKLSINVTPYVPYMGPCSLHHAARYPNLTYIPQDLATMRTMAWGANPGSFAEDMPTHTGHPFYREDRMLFFADSRSWIDHLKTVEFSFGTRIHGNIAALMAKTPAVVLVHDTRTQELVDYHEIPHRRVPDLPPGIDAAQLYEEADFTRFNAAHKEKFETFTKFLDRNGVDHIFKPGKANPDYDAALAALPLPPPLRRMRPEDTQIAMRVDWLRSQLGPNPRLADYRFRAAVPHSRGLPVGDAVRHVLRKGGSLIRKLRRK